MSYQKFWVSCTHKTSKMMSMCCNPGSGMGKYFSQVTVEPVLFLYMLSTFSQYALFQDLVYSKVCWSQYQNSPDICQHLHNVEYKSELEVVQTLASHWILMSTISLVVPSILIAMYLGSWSDRFGRKWPVVFPPLGGICACLVYIVISVSDETPVAWICLASLLSGLSGGFVSCIMSCMTYVASVTTEENRTVRISRLEAMTFFGGTVGPFISGSMLEITGHAYAFFYMMICYTVAFLYALLFVQDINKNGEIITGENNGRSRNKSSETIPSSVVATTLSTSSGGDDLEQKEGLLSNSDLHVERSITPMEITLANESSPEPHLESSFGELKNRDSCLADFNPPNILENGKIEGDGMIVSVVSHKDIHHHDLNNRNSLGSSGRNSSMHGHDDGSSAASDDDQRNIIRRRRHSSTLDDEEGNSCCMKYFSTAHCFSSIKTVAKRREQGKRSLLILSLLAGFMFMVITAGEMDVAYLFARAEPLKWTYQTYSYYFGFKYGFGAFVLIIAMPVFDRLGIQDSTIAILGILSRMAALVLYGLSVNTYMAFSVPLVAVFSVFTIPATRSLLSKLVNADEQGKMFAFVAMMEDMCTLSASLVFNSIYPLTRPILQGMIFLLAAATLILPIVIMMFVRWKIAKIQKLEELSRVSKAQLHSANGADPTALIPKDFPDSK